MLQSAIPICTRWGHILLLSLTLMLQTVYCKRYIWKDLKDLQSIQHQPGIQKLFNPSKIPLLKQAPTLHTHCKKTRERERDRQTETEKRVCLLKARVVEHQKAIVLEDTEIRHGWLYMERKDLIKNIGENMLSFLPFVNSILGSGSHNLVQWKQQTSDTHRKKTSEY